MSYVERENAARELGLRITDLWGDRAVRSEKVCGYEPAELPTRETPQVVTHYHWRDGMWRELDEIEIEKSTRRRRVSFARLYWDGQGMTLGREKPTDLARIDRLLRMGFARDEIEEARALTDADGLWVGDGTDPARSKTNRLNATAYLAEISE